VPQTSRVIILITALILPAFINLNAAALQIKPSYVNAYTYTNLTVYTNASVTVERAVVDFQIALGDRVIIGLKPTASDYILLKIGNTTQRVTVRAECNITIEAANLTSRLAVVANTTCVGPLSIYVNGSWAGIGRVDYVPEYAGVYIVTASNGIFYEKAKVVVLPNAMVRGNVFGEIMEIRLSPPPRAGLLRLGPATVQAAPSVSIDTWNLGAGNYTLALYMGAWYNLTTVTVKKAVPNIELDYKPEYIYGEPISISARVYVGKREYRAVVQLSVGGRLLIGLSPASFTLSLLDAGVYQLVAAVQEDRNVTSLSKTFQLRIAPAPVSIDLKINGTYLSPYVVNYGKILAVDASARSLVQPLGAVELYLNGTPVKPLVDTLRLRPGVYNLTAVFKPATGNFRPASASAQILVISSPPEVSINRTFSTVFGQPLAITFSVSLYGRPINATAYVEVSGRNYYANFTAAVVNGLGQVLLRDIPAGVYSGLVTVAGVGLSPQSKPFTVFVSSALVKVALTAPTRGVYGEAVPIRASVDPPWVRGVLYVEVNKTVIYAGNSSAYSGLWLPPRGGVYQISARFESLDPNYSGTENVTYIFIDRAQCTIRFSLRGPFSPEGAAYVLRRYAVEVNTDLPAKIYVNGTAAGAAVLFNKTGVYNVTVYFPGDARYYPCSSSEAVVVVKNPSSAEISSPRKITTIDAPLPISITVSSPVGQRYGDMVIYKVNKSANTTEVETVFVNGNASVYLRFQAPGVYEIAAEYLGNEFNMPSKSNVVVVTVERSLLGIPIFLLSIYLGGLGAGLAAAAVVRRVFKKSV